MDFFDIHTIGDLAKRGADIKMLQYDTQTGPVVQCNNRVNLTSLVRKLFNKHDGHDITNNPPLNNFILINIEKDIKRYHSSVEELKKLDVNNFVHLKATYWKERSVLENDLTFILRFLKQFNPDMEPIDIKINMFSEPNDSNIYIQDGPLACYCSHLRAMIYGYTHFDKYTIIAEDDINIFNTSLISDYLENVPDDWDIIFFNSIPKEPATTHSVYKLVHPFHSSHLYIIRNKSMPVLFRYMHPIFDQVDVLTSNSRNVLNIYNLPRTVYQKSVSTNTQNNLHVIFTSPNYINIKTQFDEVQRLLIIFADLILPDNEHNKTIVSNLIFDILCEYISNINDIGALSESEHALPVSGYESHHEYENLLTRICHIIQCCKKGVYVKITSTYLLHNILTMLIEYRLHNTIDEQYGQVIKAYSFGSTSHTYILQQSGVCIKQYKKVLLWKTTNHDNIDDIFYREVEILKKQDIIKLLHCDGNKKIIKMSYNGTSLYNNFILPLDWKIQIKELFDYLTANNIYYPEFRLQNILNNESKLSFVDFGMAKICDDVDNKNNCDIFIELIEILDNRFKATTQMERYLLYDTFINGIKLHKPTRYLSNVF